MTYETPYGSIRISLSDALEGDPVNKPSHYTQGGIECIDAIEAALTPQEFLGFCKGNALKYVWRAGLKGDINQDLAKAAWYINKATKETR